MKYESFLLLKRIDKDQGTYCSDLDEYWDNETDTRNPAIVEDLLNNHMIRSDSARFDDVLTVILEGRRYLGKIRDLSIMMDNIRTSQKFLTEGEYEIPTKILPDRFGNFQQLLDVREDIRHLKFLPVKEDEARATYNANKKRLAEDIAIMMGGRNIALSPNQHPYFLPPDVVQEIVWIKDGVEEETITEFMAFALHEMKVPVERVITFERPRTSRISNVPLLRGTFPAIRHIHLWREKK